MKERFFDKDHKNFFDLKKYSVIFLSKTRVINFEPPADLPTSVTNRPIIQFFVLMKLYGKYMAFIFCSDH